MHEEMFSYETSWLMPHNDRTSEISNHFILNRSLCSWKKIPIHIKLSVKYKIVGLSIANDRFFQCFDSTDAFGISSVQVECANSAHNTMRPSFTLHRAEYLRKSPRMFSAERSPADYL